MIDFNKFSYKIIDSDKIILNTNKIKNTPYFDKRTICYFFLVLFIQHILYC